jgi:hypothetical protein
MKNVMKKVFGGMAVFGALAAVFLTVAALSSTVAFADVSEESIEGLSDDDEVVVSYKVEDKDCSCFDKTYNDISMTKAEYNTLKGKKRTVIISVRPANESSETEAATEETAPEAATEATEAEATPEATEETVEETAEPIQIESALWEKVDGENVFHVSGRVSKELLDQGWKPEEFYLLPRENASLDDWIGIATAQEGVDLDIWDNEDGSISFKWSGSFYMPEATLADDADAHVCFSVHDADYTQEMPSATVCLKLGEMYER